MLDAIHIQDIIGFVNTRRGTYDALTAANRLAFTITDVEQLRALKAWMRVFRFAYDAIIPKNGNKNLPIIFPPLYV